MPQPPLPVFSDADRAEARRLNARLRWTPRFRMRGAGDALLVRALIGASQAAAGLRPRPWLPRAELRRVGRDAGHEVGLRLLHPGAPPRGLLLGAHGGAWAVGNARMDDPLNAAVVRGCGFGTASVEYRLLPRHALGEAIDDCESALLWAIGAAGREFGGPLFVGGESAGAHLALAALLRLRDRGLAGGVSGAVLFYGAYDLGGSASARRAGRDTLVLHGPGLARSLPGVLPGLDAAARRHPRWSPLFADLAGLPPALLVVGELDPLLDDTLELHARWRGAGGEATLLRVPDSPHAFNRFPTGIAAATNAHARAWMLARAGGDRG